MATAVIGLSQPIGIVLGQGITPLFVQEPSDVPLLNIVWFVPATVGLILALTTIKSSLPPTPPSRSAHLVSEQGLQECTSYLRTLKSLLTNLPCMLLSIAIGNIIRFCVLANCLSIIVYRRKLYDFESNTKLYSRWSNGVYKWISNNARAYIVCSRLFKLFFWIVWCLSLCIWNLGFFCSRIFTSLDWQTPCGVSGKSDDIYSSVGLCQLDVRHAITKSTNFNSIYVLSFWICFYRVSSVF